MSLLRCSTSTGLTQVRDGRHGVGGVSFSTIIFSDPFFAPYAGELAKLCLFSSAVHCLCFLCFSQMPFAVGQVRVTP
jgi:hypothetical protein